MAQPPPADGEPCVFFKPKKQNQNTRKRKTEEESAATSEDKVEIVKPVTQPTKKADNSFSTSKPKTNLTEDLAYKSSGTAAPVGDQKVFAYNTIDADEKDHKAEQLQQQIITDPDEAEKLLQQNDKSYKGMSNYTKYVEKKESNIKIGPIKGSLNVRYSVRFDYQPDVCKDYKETGYCGFGDNCKFMHDRGDYKSGWELEKEWEANQYGKANLENHEVPPEPEEEMPFACHICREKFTDPVVTKCGHFFCERCAFNHHKKSKKCAICGEPTGGVFNEATKLINFLKKHEEKEKEKEKVEKEKEKEKEASAS